MADSPAVSPTGTPILPVSIVPWLLLGGAAFPVVDAALNDASPWNAAKIFHLFTVLLPLLIGGMSPGWRR